ncbi:hypothetical protein ACFPFX_04380 [Streptomyces mauvecolor]|uniref:Lipoprotein n=1 Tax=Streptomyces mauvecolor TaxID=58345 RepID=A0ABV9UIE2_9ACTN
MRSTHRLRLLFAVGVVLLATGCVTVAHKTVPHGGEFMPQGARLTTVAPRSLWPDPVQPPARETLAPAYGPSPATTPAPAPDSSVGTADQPGHDQPQPAAAPAHRDRGNRDPSTARHSTPAPPHRAHPHPRPEYDPGAVCAWAQGIRLDPSVVRACREQLSR